MIRLIFILFFSSFCISFAGYWEVQIPTRIEDESKKYLKADFYSTDTTIGKPTILIQTPYNKNIYRYMWGKPVAKENILPFIDTLNFNYVIVDWRGFFGNKDKEIALYDRGLDGYDIVEWIAQQIWSDGQVGTLGGSALGTIQYQTAKHQPPHLVCAAPWIKDYRTLYENYYYGGVLRLQHVLSLANLGFGVSYQSITEFYLYSKVWENVEANSEYSDQFNIPMFLCTGWYDHFPNDIIQGFELICQNSYTDVRDDHKLMIGPWDHSNIGKLKQGDLEYQEAVSIPQERLRQFFGYYLLKEKNGWPLKPRIEYFDTGARVWHETDKELFVETDTLKLYLTNDMMLFHDFQDTGTDFSYSYDPLDPSPTIGGAVFDPFNTDVVSGPVDQYDVLNRNDNIAFVSDNSIEFIKLEGSIRVHLFISSDRKDTDFAVRLCDVYPDGKWVILNQAIQRMRFRYSLNTEELMVPNEIYEVGIKLEPITHTFDNGHRLGLIISSSNYPFFDLNLNNGEELYENGDTLIAKNTIYVSGDNPSYILIPTNSNTSVERQTNDDYNVVVFPIPSIDMMFVKSDVHFESYSIFDMTGRLVSEGLFSTEVDEIKQIYTNILQNGIYILKLSIDKYEHTKKFIINR